MKRQEELIPKMELFNGMDQFMFCPHGCPCPKSWIRFQQRQGASCTEAAQAGELAGRGGRICSLVLVLASNPLVKATLGIYLLVTSPCTVTIMKKWPSLFLFPIPYKVHRKSIENHSTLLYSLLYNAYQKADTN